jgi:hypothetical protein
MKDKLLLWTFNIWILSFLLGFLLLFILPEEGALSYVPFGFIILGAISGIVMWIKVLVIQAKRKEWAWFIFTIVFRTIPILIYLPLRRKEL